MACISLNRVQHKGKRLPAKSPPLAPLKCFYAVAVCATYLAFGYFGFYARPSTALREQVRYLICFVTVYVVKLKDTDIGFAAIDTGMIAEVDTQHLIAFSCLSSRLGTTPTLVMLNCFNTMTVGTTYFALSDFSFNSGPVNDSVKTHAYG